MTSPYETPIPSPADLNRCRIAALRFINTLRLLDMFQQIYVDALAEPAIGYEASRHFQRALFDCPKCRARVYIRIRQGTRAPLRATCTKCPWLTTYLLKPALPTPPRQRILPLGPEVAPPEV